MRTPPAIFVSLISVVAIMSAIFMILVLRRISTHRKTVETKLKLKPHETHVDFKILTVSNLLLSTVLITYGIGGLLMSETILVAAEAAMVLVSLPVALVFYKIWRRIR